MAELPAAHTLKSSKITPLWIVAAFVTLTEVVLGYAITKVEGWIQGILTVFVMLFAAGVAATFFAILWNRPFVFYPPSEYGGMDPNQFMDAFKQSSGPMRFAQEIQNLAKVADANPFNDEARFKLVDAMADDAQIQAAIFMHERNIDLPNYCEYVYEHESGSPAGHGSLSFDKRSLLGAGLVVAAGGGRMLALTQDGHKFAEWLVRGGRKASFFMSSLGGWGTPREGGFAVDVMKERFANKPR